MCSPSAHARRLLAVAAATLIVPVLLAGPASAGPDRVNPGKTLSFFGSLSAVAATSAGNAWAVGSQGGLGAGHALIMRWNGASWKRVSVPGSGTGSILFGVAATSASNAWAVGETSHASALILRWNGASWRQVTLPATGGARSELKSVSANSSGNAWAVGCRKCDSNGSTPLILHWTGSAWHLVPSPVAISGSQLSGVSVRSATSAWAVGCAPCFTSAKTLILHWGGLAWHRFPSPNPTAFNQLTAVSVSGTNSAWAVGSDRSGTLVMHRGFVWQLWRAPRTGSLSQLNAVVAPNAACTWAAGTTGGFPGKTLILRRFGPTWTRVPSPTPAQGGVLFGLASLSPRDAWAVGSNEADEPMPLILHWNGSRWS